MKKKVHILSLITAIAIVTLPHISSARNAHVSWKQYIKNTKTVQRIKKALANKSTQLIIENTHKNTTHALLCGLECATIVTALAYQAQVISELKQKRKTFSAYARCLAQSTLSWTAIVTAYKLLQRNPFNPLK